MTDVDIIEPHLANPATEQLDPILANDLSEIPLPRATKSNMLIALPVLTKLLIDNEEAVFTNPATEILLAALTFPVIDTPEEILAKHLNEILEPSEV
jgi:hypothetical protein